MIINSLLKGLPGFGGCDLGGVGVSWTGVVGGVAGGEASTGRRALPGTGLNFSLDSNPASGG